MLGKIMRHQHLPNLLYLSRRPIGFTALNSGVRGNIADITTKFRVYQLKGYELAPTTYTAIFSFYIAKMMKLFHNQSRGNAKKCFNNKKMRSYERR